MFGRRAIIADWAAEQELSDTFATDRDGDGAFGLGTTEDQPGRWSHSLLDADLGIQASPLPIDGYHQTGWLAFA